MSTENETEQKFDTLTSDIDWQYLHLYKFIVKYFNISKSEREGKEIASSEKIVQRVLFDYLYLVEKFYTQFRDDLKKEYIGRNVLDINVPVLMQEALDKLVEEWERVYSFIAINPKSDTKGTKEFLEHLTPIINTAIRDVGFNPDSVRVIPQFGNAYSLGFFNYSDDFMALNVPLTKIKSPWEWTIFWHEIAGLRVRLLKTTLFEYQNLLKELFEEVKRESNKELFTDLKGIENNPEKYGKEVDEFFVACGMILLVSGFSMAFKKDFDTSPSLGDSNPISEKDLLRANAKDLLDFLENNDLSLKNTRMFFKDRSLPMIMFSFDDLFPEIMDEFRAQQEARVINELHGSLKTEVLNIRKEIGDAQGDSTLTLVSALRKALTLNEDFTARKKALDEQGWSGDWLEELFEDSFSVMNFNFEFLFIFDNVLRRYGRKDQRHPPREVRLAVALSLKLLRHKPQLKEVRTLPDDVADWPAWDQTVMGLADETEYKSLIEFFNNLKTDKEVVWLVAKEIFELHEWSEIPHRDGEEKKAITNAMAGYRIGNSHQDWEKNANATFEFLGALRLESANTTDKLSLGDDRIDKERDKVDEYDIHNLLHRKRLHPEPLGYRELLELSFYDEDFGTLVPTYSFKYGSSTYFITATNLATAINSNFIFNSKPTNVLTDQITINNISYWTTPANIDAMKDSSRRLI